MFVPDQPIHTQRLDAPRDPGGEVARSGGTSSPATDPVSAVRAFEAARRAIDLLRAQARVDRSFRDGLRELGALLLHIADATQPEPASSPPASAPRTAAPASSASEHAAAAAKPPPRQTPPAVGILPLQLGDARVEVVVPGTGAELEAMQRRDLAAEREAQREAELARERAAMIQVAARSPEVLPDLEVLAQHARLKAECVRWAVERRRRERAGADHAELRARDAELLARARAEPACWVWSLSPHRVTQPDADLERLAEVHENLALAARLVADLEAVRPEDAAGHRPEAWQLLAEAQSALRKALLDLDLDTDSDQDDAFLWLRSRTERDRVFVARHMRISDPADPDGWTSLRQRIAAASAQLRDAGDASKVRRRLLSKVRFIAGKLADAEDADCPGHWRGLDDAVGGLVEAGVNPSDRDLRELLAPVLDSMPASFEAGPALRRTVQAIESWLERDDAESAPRERAPSPEVRRVADLLRGTVVLLIGGERRRPAEEALRKAFDLAELRWVATQEHQSIAPFEAEVARRDVALVLLPIRWASHSFEGVQEFCERYGKPFVRLPGGYNPNRVAIEVLRQVERRLVEARQRNGPSLSDGPTGAFLR